MTDYTYRRGDVCWFNDPIPVTPGTFVSHGKHPAVIVSDDTMNFCSNTVLVATMTSNTLKRIYPGQFDIHINGKSSRVRCDQIRVVDKDTLDPPFARLSPEAMHKLDETLKFTFGLSNGFAVADTI